MYYDSNAIAYTVDIRIQLLSFHAASVINKFIIHAVDKHNLNNTHVHISIFNLNGIAVKSITFLYVYT